ncbi:MAG: nucleoside triphosphate pyrophosphohydrolase [Clostridia bacterium]|nr:nucleoside triphosphate pyrophosphohydrolase [Clostridia bacterium]
MNSFTYFTGEDFIKRKIANFECNIPIIIDGIDEEIFPKVKEKLLFNFGKHAVAVILDEGGNPEEITIENLTYRPRLIIKCADFICRDYYTFGDLVEIIRRLRDPDGCQWDKAQTNESIRNNAIEEAYELVEAVNLHDREKMVEESGDVLLQGLFHASIAEESGFFTPVDVINGICHKLVSRHTHIFGENKAQNAEEALKFWEQAKAVEKGYGGLEDKINSVPVTFGALMRAYKVQKIIKKCGFDFEDAKGALQKVYEELDEMMVATTPEEQEKEAGDVLFAVLNVLRFLKVDPELALTGTTNRFIKRFLYVEQKAKEIGFELIPENLELMEKYYQEGKKILG